VNTTAGKRASRLIRRIQQARDQAMDRLPEHLGLYYLKKFLQADVAQRGRALVAHQLLTWDGVDEDCISWLLDTPPDEDDAYRWLRDRREEEPSPLEEE
jgi:hypothetical protein